MTEDRVESCPKITPFLREVRGGKSLAIKAMRFSDGELVRVFLEKYDSIPERDRQNLPFEAIALAAELNIRHLWGEMMIAIREHSVSSVKMIAVSAHPTIMKARVEYAKTPGGFRDRDKLDEILGAIKAPQGSTFIGKAFFGGSGEQEPAQGVEDTVDDVDLVFPDCELMQERVQPMRQKLLEARK